METIPEVQLVTLFTRILREIELTDNHRIAQEPLSRRLNVTMRTVQRHLVALEREGFIHVYRNQGKPYTYAIEYQKGVPYMPNEWRVAELLD